MRTISDPDLDLPRGRGVRGAIVVPLVPLMLMGVVVATAGCGGGSSSSISSTTRPDSTATAPTSSVDPNAPTTIDALGGVQGPVGRCLELSGTFSSLVQGVLQGADGARRSQQAAEQMKSELPPGLQADADVVAATFGRIAANDGQVTQADLDDSAYKAAVAALGKYFAGDCRS